MIQRKEFVMTRYALLIAFCVLSVSAAFAQTKTPVEGVWKMAEVVIPAGGRFNDWTSESGRAEKDTTITNPQPGLLIFTRGYYSVLHVRGQQPRPALAPPKDRQHLTDAEKVAMYEQWRLVVANAGTYEVKGSTLFLRPMVSKGVDVMTREKPVEVTFKLEGPNTLWMISATSATEARHKLIKVE
jgi:hypothetical protein